MKRFLLILLLAVFLGAAAGAALAEETENIAYGGSLFESGYVHRIDIRIAESDWESLLADALEKTKYEAGIEIDGEVLEGVSFNAKGNSSLAFVAADEGSTRYSFKVNFGKYVKGQTFHGLRKLSLCNCFGDKTYMKDYFSYEIFRQLGVPAPLTSYVWLTVNGRDQGLYLAVEDVSESFLDRVFGGEGVVYKPECGDMALTAEMAAEIMANGLEMPSDPHGADLVYTDDDPQSYPDVFENAETKAGEQDALAVIAAMKCLAEGKDPYGFLDTDEIIRFFAAHNFILNYDSYIGGMLHNMVLVENNGRLSLVPWDYNFGFGTFTPVVGNDSISDATDILNQGIDTPLIGAAEDSRPLWKWIAQDPGRLAQYHDALDALVMDYFASGRFDQELDALSEMLLPYVKKDPTAFFTEAEFRNGYEALRLFCTLRAESVRMQLAGALSACSGEQPRENKVDASGLALDDLGVAV